MRGELFVVGGLENVSDKLVPTAKVDKLVFSASTQTCGHWERVTDLKTPRYDVTAVADGKVIE